MIAAGPAIWDAVSAPKSHPEPMIEPTPANSSPSRPTSRRSPRSSATTWVGLPAPGPSAVAAAPARPWALRFRPRVAPV
jgi:hypothetical protein